MSTKTSLGVIMNYRYPFLLLMFILCPFSFLLVSCSSSVVDCNSESERRNGGSKGDDEKDFVSVGVKKTSDPKIDYFVKLNRVLLFKNNTFIDLETNKVLEKRWHTCIESNTDAQLVGDITLGFADDQINIKDQFSGMTPTEGMIFFEFEIVFDNGQSLYVYTPTNEKSAKRRFPKVSL